MSDQHSEIPLGKNTEYPKRFDAGLLFAMPRQQARESLGIDNAVNQRLPFVGYDDWTLYELSWLDSEGSPQMAIGLLRVPADSECIVESKSLKLYANSLYYRRFASNDDLVEQITADLNRLLKCQVQFSLMDLNQPFPRQDERHNAYQSIDHHRVELSASADITRVSVKPENAEFRYRTRRFRSLCPVTGQPDWASLYIHLQGANIDAAELAQYLAGFSEHQGFHENCVERIYIELQDQLKPKGLSVAARYTRRGGIDINPIRASSEDLLDMPARELRQ